MKICPTCNSRYEDTEEVCPLDGTALAPLTEEPAAKNDITSEIDTERVKEEVKELALPPLELQPKAKEEPAAAAVVPAQAKRSRSFAWAILVLLMFALVGSLVYLYVQQSGREVMVEIKSDPGGADVYVDGVYMGKAPVNQPLRVGKHIVVFEQDGYEISQELIEVTKDGHVHVQKLVRLKSPAP